MRFSLDIYAQNFYAWFFFFLLLFNVLLDKYDALYCMQSAFNITYVTQILVPNLVPEAQAGHWSNLFLGFRIYHGQVSPDFRPLRMCYMVIRNYIVLIIFGNSLSVGAAPHHNQLSLKIVIGICQAGLLFSGWSCILTFSRIWTESQPHKLPRKLDLVINRGLVLVLNFGIGPI